MNPNWAEENLQTIRTLMERSALYRRALAPIMIFVGAVGIIGGLIGSWMQIDSAHGFVFFWSGIAAVALAGAFLLIRRQALKDSEPFWSPPTRRVAEAMAPPFFVGAVIGGIVTVLPDNHELQVVLTTTWCWAFGFAIHSAGFFMQRGIKFFGWIFILLGCLLIPFQGVVGFRDLLALGNAHLLMAAIFGGLHLAYGIYLYFTEKKTPVA